MGKKILLADDSITIQKVIELTFSDEDFDVVTVGNGRLALERMTDVRPDIVLCDIIMPEKDGYEVCEQIKKNPSFSHVPVLLLTGAFEPFDQERAARAGYDGSLAKPFEPETLIAKVRDLLARAPQRAAAPAPLPPPVVPFARPAAPVAPPPFMPPPPPAPPVGLAGPTTTASFISDEPFETEVDDRHLEPVPSSTVRETPASLAPMSEEESATLLAAPAAEPEPDELDRPGASTSTVMFNASDLPWNMAPAPVTAAHAPVSIPPAPPSVVPPPPPSPTLAFVPEPQAVFEPEPVDSAEVVEDTTVFEEVVEEDLDFDAARAAGFDEAEPADTGATMMFSGTRTLPPSTPSPIETSATTASFGAREEEVTYDEPELEPLPPPEPEPEPVQAAPPLPVFMPAPPPPPPPARMLTPPSMPAARALAPPVPAPPPPPVQSFADVAPSIEETTMPPASEAAAVSVPVDMVEKIAQRVVAQISEKAVREIAWEVIPELAEALIKQEIERLKAELQKI